MSIVYSNSPCWPSLPCYPCESIREQRVEAIHQMMGQVQILNEGIQQREVDPRCKGRQMHFDDKTYPLPIIIIIICRQRMLFRYRVEILTPTKND